MKASNFSMWVIALATFSFIFTSCGSNRSPIISGSNVTVTNTFQSTAFTGGEEQDIESLFQVPAGSLAATATVGDDIEFSAYLLNLYDIDIDEKNISFEVVAQEDDPTYGMLFRVLEEGTVDRYYLTFDDAQNVESFNANNEAVNLRIDSESVLVVEIGEGYDFKPGQSFNISLSR